MESANELRKIALEKQECDYLYKYNYTTHLINEILKERAEKSLTWVFLIRKGKAWTCYNQVFYYIDNKLYKDLKKYYKKKGFKII